jgi:hypothetical protein
MMTVIVADPLPARGAAVGGAGGGGVVVVVVGGWSNTVITRV